MFASSASIRAGTSGTTALPSLVRTRSGSDGGALVVLERDSGEVMTSLPLPGVPDVLMHDPDLRRLYVAIGEPGLVCSFDSERLEQLETVETEEGAHTTCWDPVGRGLYVFGPRSGGAAVYEERA